MAEKVPAHKHQLRLATAPRDPGDPNHRDLMSCAFDRCIHTEVVCSDCVREGRSKFIPGFHYHGADGTITGLWGAPSSVTPVRPPGYVAPPKKRAKKAKPGKTKPAE